MGNISFWVNSSDVDFKLISLILQIHGHSWSIRSFKWQMLLKTEEVFNITIVSILSWDTLLSPRYFIKNWIENINHLDRWNIEIYKNRYFSSSCPKGSGFGNGFSSFLISFRTSLDFCLSIDSINRSLCAISCCIIGRYFFPKPRHSMSSKNSILSWIPRTTAKLMRKSNT